LKLLFDTMVQPGALTVIDPLALIPDVLPEPVCKATRQGCPPDPAEVDVLETTSLVDAADTVTDGVELKAREMVSGTAFCTFTSTAASELDFTPATICAVALLSVYVLVVAFQVGLLAPVTPLTSAILAARVAAVCAAVALLRQLLPLLLRA
jgi:hypothetical protein